MSVAPAAGLLSVRSDRTALARRLPAAAAVAGVPFAAFTGLVLYHFYLRGSFVLDAGLQVSLLSHGGWRLPYPAALGGGSYWRSHVAPIFVLLSLLRRTLPVSDVQFFAGFIGLAHALPAIGVFWALRAAAGRGAAATGAALLLAIAFAFNGLALSIVRYPHFEMLIVGSVICFAAALAQRRLIVAGAFFSLALATREDAGFHLFALLFLLIAVNRWYGVAWRAQRAELGFAAAGLLYSLVVVGLQTALATGPSALVQIYTGEPPFATLTAATVATRLAGCLVYRAYLVLPAAAAAIWALRARNPYILIGYAAFLPWGALQLVAHSAIAGTLSGYYAFPFMIAAFWPLIGVLYFRRGTAGKPAAAMLPFAAMTALSFVGMAHQYNPGRLDLLTGFLSPPSLARQGKTDRAVALLARSQPALGRLLLDTSVVALAADDFSREETLQGAAKTSPDTVAYLAHGYDADKLRRLAAADHLNRHYDVPGTAIRIATDRAIAAPTPIASLIAGSGNAD
ncbi:MAG TPA: hypothetical protein VME41_07535 [Stellaceae bacterium]|nr:hypothetical protein [Stellaceae bacterium]